MNIAQQRSIKFVRPTDECDVCEGIGIDYGADRFERVRSIVRENALWSAVILCSHGAGLLGRALERTVAALVEVVETDKNVFSVGSALDALCRLVYLRPDGDAPNPEHAAQLRSLLEAMPIHSWEPLVRSGLPKHLAREIEYAQIERA